MTRKVRVHVVAYGDCKNLVLRYVDPVTGKTHRTTKYVDPTTKVETPTGDNRKFARKLAAMWEGDLNSGRDVGRCCTGWQQFRLRYESEVVPGFAAKTGSKIGTAFNCVERFLPRVANGKLTDLDAEAVSRIQAGLRAGGLSENTIAAYLAHLRSALGWAVDQGMIQAIPKIKRPQRAQKGGRARKSKGRPITAEEFDRLLEKIPAALVDWRRRRRESQRAAARRKGKAEHRTNTDSIPVEVNPAAVESWAHFLRGLWMAGLRLAESLELYWDRRGDKLYIDLSGRRARMRIPAELEKGNQDRVMPLTPDFAAFLLSTPEADRRGPVFRPLMPSGARASGEQAGRMVSIIGELARVVVHTDARNGKVKHASAHDLRRSFGNRWARKVMPAVLQRLMRHESIDTTMGYYVDLDADELAEDLYRQENEANGPAGIVLRTVDEIKPISEVEPNDTNPYNESDLGRFS